MMYAMLGVAIAVGFILGIVVEKYINAIQMMYLFRDPEKRKEIIDLADQGANKINDILNTFRR